MVIEGKGKTEIGGQTFDWEPNDIMVVPNFVWRKHINTGTSDAILYTVSDSALLRSSASTARRARTRPAR